DSADPNLPDAVQVALEIVPVLPCPDASFTWTPLPSLNPKAATRPLGFCPLFSTSTCTSDDDELPAASRATAVSACGPFDAVPVFHATVYGGEVRSAPSAASSTLNCTPATATSSDAVAVTLIVPDAVACCVGAVMLTVGAVVSASTMTIASLEGWLTLPAMSC